MKRTLLFAVALGIGLAVSAQSICKKPPFAMQDGQGNPNKSVSQSNSSLKNGNNTPAPLAITACDTTGYSGNAYGAFTRPGRSLVYADPNCGTIIYTHRSSPARDGTSNTGNIMYDRSVDGGLTWTTTHQGPVYVPSGENGRYPQGVIYNPGNQTNPALCFMAAFGPNTNGTNWVSYHNAAQPLMGGSAVQQVFQFGVGYPQGLIPFNSDFQQDGTWRVIDIMNYGPPLYDYNDTLMLNVGTWNTSALRYDFNLSKVYFPVSLDGNGYHNLTHAGVAFAKTGGIGYLMVLGHDQPFSGNFVDSANYLIIRKTTDGGVTWGTPSRLCLGVTIDAMMNNSGGGMYTHGFDFDAIVDVNNNLHIAIITSPQATGGGWSVPTASYKIMSDVYTTDGGSSWYIKKIAETMTFRGEFGTGLIPEDNRPQVSANWNRDRLFFSWFDTDTLQFAGQGNAYPDHHVVGANVTSATSIMWTADQNTSASSSCASGTVTFGSVPEYVLSSSGVHMIPLSYMVLINNDDVAECQFRFGEGITVTDASMTVAGNPVQIGCNIGMNEDNNNLFAVGNLFPNPTSNNTSFGLNINTASQVTINVTNAIGQNVVNVANDKFSAGLHKINVSTTGLQSGIYFINVNAGGFTVTKKLVIQ